MDEALSRINDAFRLAGELMGELPAIRGDPVSLAGRCHGIADAYSRAAGMLHPYGAGVGVAVAAPPPPPPQFAADRISAHRTTSLLRLGCPEDHTAGGGAAPRPFLGSEPPAATTAAPFLTPADVFGTRAPPADTSGGPLRRPLLASSSRSPPAVLPRQGRRRREGGERLTVMVPGPLTGNNEVPPDDGYTWRKYGQKDILGSTYPRSYYRCTHKNYYGCEAKKKVQRLDDDPFTYEVTYCGAHTCLTSTTPLLASPATPVHASDLLTMAPPLEDESAAAGRLSTSIQLGFSSWMPAIRAGSGEGSSGQSMNLSADAAAGRDTDYPALDLADAMFNSGGGSMDGIFSSHDRSS